LRDECLLATQRSRTTLCAATVRGEAADKTASTIRKRSAQKGRSQYLQNYLSSPAPELRPSFGQFPARFLEAPEGPGCWGGERRGFLVVHLRNARQKQLVEVDIARKIAQTLQDLDDRAHFGFRDVSSRLEKFAITEKFVALRHLFRFHFAGADQD